METYRAIGKFINKSVMQESARDPFKLYSALFEEEGGTNAWINVTEKQYRSIKLGERVNIEVGISSISNGTWTATLFGKEKA